MQKFKFECIYPRLKQPEVSCGPSFVPGPKHSTYKKRAAPKRKQKPPKIKPGLTIAKQRIETEVQQLREAATERRALDKDGFQILTRREQK